MPSLPVPKFPLIAYGLRGYTCIFSDLCQFSPIILHWAGVRLSGSQSGTAQCWAAGLNPCPERYTLTVLTPSLFCHQDGSTPLHYAAAFGHAGAVETLVQAGCDVDVRDHACNTPLHLAAGTASPPLPQLHRRQPAAVPGRLVCSFT